MSLTKREIIHNWFADHNVNINDLVDLVVDNQHPYIDNLKWEEAKTSVLHVMNKREFQHAMITAIFLDNIADTVGYPQLLENPLLTILIEDAPDYGIDEQLALSVAGLYGSISVSNFGMLDKQKPGIIGVLNEQGKSRENVTTMMDDMICAIVSSAAARLAHQHQEEH